MRELVASYLCKSISRRGFLKGLTKAGVSLAAAESILKSLTPHVQAQEARRAAPEGVKLFQGTGGAAFAEQLIASGVKYVFGNSASSDASFYEALVDRPQLKYILTPHEGPGAAMAAGYVKASGEPTLVMQAGFVGLANAMGQMFNAFKEQTPVVYYSYRSDATRRSGRDGFEEVANQEQVVQPLTKYSWLARRADMIPETVRRAFKAAWTPPYGPTYASWHTDFIDETVRTEIISHEKIDPRMRIRPNPKEVERAAKLLVEAKSPLMIVGDELYNAKAVDKAVKLAEMIGMPVTQVRQVFCNFPESHSLWVGSIAGRGVESLTFPKDVDVVINVGNKLQHGSPAPIVPRATKFIDLRNDSWSMGNVITTEALTYEVAQFADKDAIIVHEAGSIGLHSFGFNPLGGRELFFYYGAHLGSGVGTAAGVKLARPNQQVICLVGDGSFVFGPTALWNMARQELPVITVVYNNHAYAGPHSRAVEHVAGGRMVQTGQFVHDYLGNPDMNMVHIAKGFGVEGEAAESPGQLKEALVRARRATQDGKPYLIDAQVRRTGVGWVENPWTPPIRIAQTRTRKV